MAIIAAIAMMLTTAIVALAGPIDGMAAADTGGSRNMYRLYNRNSGEHFYTANAAERNMLIHAGWRYEGIGWVAPARSSRPVYRLYNRHAGDHHYTMNGAEKNMLVRVGWKYEGIGWYSSDTNRSYPLYRQYNPHARRGTHNYTLNGNERNMLVRAGWRDEGLAWYAVGPGRADDMYTALGLPTCNSARVWKKYRDDAGYIWMCMASLPSDWYPSSYYWGWGGTKTDPFPNIGPVYRY
ncbi:hypothetical protein [Bifidobacterium simiarum]|uniref:hypothetical protein n=1 Tax=Bifidobacterium simiarum TaxID=2045441 RepID=UPI001F0AC3F8|nr:hypothetical protein [Bifidobacterium simiarum]